CPGADAEVEKERPRGVRADAHVERMTERELPAKPHHHVPGLAGVGEVEDQRSHRDRVRSGQSRKKDQGEEQERQKGVGAAHDFFPRRPCGRRSRTRMRRPKLSMLLADGAMNRPASASEVPMRTPPRSAPAIEPRPPTITITNASSV